MVHVEIAKVRGLEGVVGSTESIHGCSLQMRFDGVVYFQKQLPGGEKGPRVRCHAPSAVAQLHSQPGSAAATDGAPLPHHVLVPRPWRLWRGRRGKVEVRGVSAAVGEGACGLGHGIFFSECVKALDGVLRSCCEANVVEFEVTEEPACESDVATAHCLDVRLHQRRVLGRDAVVEYEVGVDKTGCVHFLDSNGSLQKDGQRLFR
mmetsp:Transcript_63182/g.126827  ORF Transcript_63182/g.126827 Transcript_63182/m.126827 type:complete len:205 (-) Transcript_63182:373-987(-)